MNITKKLKIYLGISYIILISTFLYFFLNKFSIQEISSYEFIKNNVDYFSDLKSKNYFLLLTVFFFFVIFWVLLLGFGSPVALASGFIFGKWIGTIVITLSLSIGALILYLITIFFFKDFIHQKLENKMVFLKNLFKRNEFLYFLIYRFVGGIPFVIANTLPVIFNVKIKNYFFGTLIGMIPQLFIVVSIGSGLEKIIDANNNPPSFFQILFSKDIYLPLIAFLFIIIISFFLKKKLYR
ncbi:MAG: TVP38/TMEM64 family protein [Candidatus Pelagibacter sp.]|tara:strand:+ start:187 stop:903 length:717 start_codon:yes stop_codon:yes gene_type:complete